MDQMSKVEGQVLLIFFALCTHTPFVLIRGVVSADSSAESKRKKRKIEAEGLVSNSKKFRRLVDFPVMR